MIWFRSDYSLGAHPDVLKALCDTNGENTDGYGIDPHCENAANIIKELTGVENCAVHFLHGGTPCNIVTISAALRPYEAVVCAKTGHIYAHETGGVEATGHRVITVDGIDGKLTPALLEKALIECSDEHTLSAKMVYISQPTEIGTVYSKRELTALREKCLEKGLYLYIDGARLGSALTSSENDIDIKMLASLCDVFYIGGTKNGALMGEALVITNMAIDDHFRWMIKQHCSMLAKGRILGVQFEVLLTGGEDSLYYKIAAHANKMAERLRRGISCLGVEFLGNSPTNQVFPILPVSVIEALEKDFFFTPWGEVENGMMPIRLVTSFGTTEAEVDSFIMKLSELITGK